MALRKEVETTKLEFGTDWIEVRTDRKYGDTVKAQRAAASRYRKPAAARRDKREDDDLDITFDISAFNLALLTAMIVSWSDDVPVNKDTIQELPDAVIQRVLEVISGESEAEEERGPLEKNSITALESPEASGQPEMPAEDGPST